MPKNGTSLEVDLKYMPFRNREKYLLENNMYMKRIKKVRGNCGQSEKKEEKKSQQTPQAQKVKRQSTFSLLFFH